MIETTISPTLQTDDLLWRQLKTIPAFRAILRAVEARFYYSIDLPGPVLDVGCGDGHFAQMIFQEKITAGIDPWWGPLQKGRMSNMYELALQAMGDALPFAHASFASGFSNSVLEHIPDIQPVLNDVSRVLQPNGRFVITTPSHYFTEYLGGAAFFERLGLDGLADQYRSFFNAISRHAHTDSPEVWAARLAKAGFAIERWQYYFSQSALRALEWGHVQGLPAAASHFLTGHWILAPWESSLKRTEEWLRPFYDEPFEETGVYLLIIARKQADGPIPTNLPAPRPFALAELEAGVQRAQGSHTPAEIEESMTESTPVIIQPEPIPLESQRQPDLTTAETPHAKKKSRDVLSLTLVILSLLSAMFGQLVISSDAATTGRGLRWFAASALGLLLVALRRGSRSRSERRPLRILAQLPRKRWGVLLALLLSLLAFRQVRTFGDEKELLAFLLWFGAIALGIYSLGDSRFLSLPESIHLSRRTMAVGGILTFTALVIRFVQLTQNPFMLNGLEASLALDAARISQNLIRNPFGTGWLTNPNLLLYLEALPVHLFGQTIFAARFLSPIVGSLTVTSVYFLGKRIWSEAIAILAAILLLGSHLHLHFSRLGMTNIWDPLLLFLALGSVALAWKRPYDAPKQRSLWLWTGLLLGLNAYAFTSSHLLPVILLLCGSYWLLFDRGTLRQQARHLLAALLLALVVGLPLLLFYRNNPTIFMERFNALSIFREQSGWLAQQAALAGQSTTQQLLAYAQQALLAFNGLLDKSPAYRPLVPLLSFGPAVLFVVGIITAVSRLRDFRYALLIIWVLVTLAANFTLVELPQSHRLVIATPALALLAGLALVSLGRMVASAWQPDRTSRLSRRLLTVLTALAVLLALNDVAFYFGRFPRQNEYADRNTEVADKMSRYLDSLDGEWTVYFYGPPIMFIDFPTFAYLLPGFQPSVNFFNVEPGSEITVPPIKTENLVFFYLPENVAALSETKAMWGNGRIETISGQYGDPLFIVYRVEN